MKYWGFLVLKLFAAAALGTGIIKLIHLTFSQRTYVFYSHPDAFAHDLGYTTLMMLVFLFCIGVLYLIIWDHRYRCRTCLRRLRMPLHAGSWPNPLLFGQPRTEYICPYGHGTLKVSDFELTRGSGPDWQLAHWEPHDEDIWKELAALEESNK